MNKESIDKYNIYRLKKNIPLHLNMNQHSVHLLDLPNELLFIILRKLENVDVLYSLMNINNQRLDSIAQDQIFTNVLNFVSILQSTDEISISGSILNRFCVNILPTIHENVKSLTAESVSMECILGAGNYPNLTELKIFNFNKAIALRYFIGKIFMCFDLLKKRLAYKNVEMLTFNNTYVFCLDDSLFGQNYKQQITNLTLISNEDNIEMTQEEYTQNVYAIVLTFFENLKHLSVVVSFIEKYPGLIRNYPCLSLYELPPTTFFSPTLTKLCINVTNLYDVYALLDGRLKQLTIFIVQVEFINNPISISYTMVSLCEVLLSLFN